MSNRSTADDTEPDPVVIEAVRLRWKHALIAFLLGTTTYALYQVAGSWSLDAAVFGLATLAVIVYSIATFGEDLS